MKNNKIYLLTVIFLFVMAATAFCGSLQVGTKVIYPGGADQPPKEKDTGVSLNAEVTGIARETADAGEQSPEEIYDRNDYETTIEILKKRSDHESKTFTAIALFNLGNEDEAAEMARKLLEDPELPEELLYRLCDELELEYPEPD
jgi:hypothetical protein